jgi:hypothetical protein
MIARVIINVFRKYNNLKIAIVALVLGGFVNSCMPEDDPVKPYNRGSKQVSTVVMGADYSQQIYFSLDKNQIVKQNSYQIWDLGFACSDDRNEIILNFAKSMKAFDAGAVGFDKISSEYIKSIKTEDWTCDNSEGKIDSIVLGSWHIEQSGAELSSNNHIYVLDRGGDPSGRKKGYAAIRIKNMKNGKYSIEFKIIGDEKIYTASISKNTLYNYVYFSFDNGGEIKELEPPKETWDILFTKYTQLLYTDAGEKLWYSVTSALINQFYCKAALSETVDFDTVDANYMDKLNLLSYRNAIGHDWKTYDFETGAYKTNIKDVFFILSASGFKYKLRFLDFYDSKGEKGAPNFEFVKL